MADLSNTVYRYYLDSLTELPFDKQFHFASRLYLWSHDTGCEGLLRQLRPDFTCGENPQAALEQVIAEAGSAPLHGSKNAAELRKPYFEKYPMLKTYVTVLFRLTFLQTVYGIDAHSAFHRLFNQRELEIFRSKLLRDHNALAILSTHAINFLYLYDRMLQQNDTTFNPQAFLELGEHYYDHGNRIHLQLLIYLYTHCIIGESHFYARRLPETYLATYRRMIKKLEELISQHFEDINLDNKFEFLVCAQLVGLTSRLTNRIFEEAELSLSEHGSFLIDRHNANPQADNVSLDKSEHRNVLFIMANRPFNPGRNVIR